MLTTLIISFVLTTLSVIGTVIFYKKTMYNPLTTTATHFGIVLVVCALTIMLQPGRSITGVFIVDIITAITMFGLIAFIALLLILTAGEIVKD